MLLDHLYATVLHDHLWLTYVGRIAFPLFAFELVQGYMHTHDLRRYAKRILLLAVLSEIPFDMVAGASFFYIWHQNVAWTLLAGLGACCCADHLLAKETAASRRVLYLLGLVGTVLLPRLLMTDYGAEGVLLILLFWFTRKGGAVNYLIQVVVMFVMWQFVFCGRALLIGSFVFQTQCFALCALPLICTPPMPANCSPKPTGFCPRNTYHEILYFSVRPPMEYLSLIHIFRMKMMPRMKRCTG